MKLLTLIISSLLTFTVFAHDGHNATPGSMKSIHGGVVLNGKELNLEIIINGKNLTAYPVTHEGKDVPEKEIKITGLAKPKKGKPYPVNFSYLKNSYNLTVDLQGANRLPIEIVVKYQGKVDTFTAQVEE